MQTTPGLGLTTVRTIHETFKNSWPALTLLNGQSTLSSFKWRQQKLSVRFPRLP